MTPSTPPSQLGTSDKPGALMRDSVIPGAVAHQIAESELLHARQGTSLQGRIPALTEATMDLVCDAFSDVFQQHDSNGNVCRFAYGDSSAVPGTVIELKGDQSRMLWQPQRDWRVRELESRAWFDFSGYAKLLAFAMSYEAAISWWSELLGEPLMPVALVGPEQVASQIRPAVALHYRVYELGLSQCIAFGKLWLSPHTLARLLQKIRLGSDSTVPREEVVRPRSDLSWLAEVPLSLSTQLEPVTLSAQELALLKSGDVIGLGAKHPALHQGIVEVCGYRRWHCKIGKDGWRIQRTATTSSSFPYHQENPMEPNDTPDGAQGAALDQIALQLSFELDRKAISMAELSQLQTGYVFKLGSPLEGRNVTLLANGAVIGNGELVSVGDFLGVRVLDFKR
jgi:type III secretion protein Q